MNKDIATAKEELVYPELSYAIIGILFDVYNKLGYGHKEIVYQRAIAASLKNIGLEFKEQVYAPVIFKNTVVGKNFFDFLIDNKVVLEIKRGNYFCKSHIEQIYQYLVVGNLKLGILIYFSPTKLHFKRIVNIK